MVSREIELAADLNAEDDDGLNWTLLSAAAHPELIRAGAVVTAGRAGYWSWVRVIRVDPDGQVHFQQLTAVEARQAENPADAC
jgi:hypothetical protein